VFDARPKKRYAPKAQTVLHGVSASPEIAIGTAFVVGDDRTPAERRAITEAEIPREIAKLQQALEKARLSLLKDHVPVAGQLGEEKDGLLEVYRMMLDDEYFIGEVIETIRAKFVNADYAFQEHVNQYTEQLIMRGGHFAEIAGDLHDIRKQVVQNIQGEQPQNLAQRQDGVIIISHDLTPSLFMGFDHHKIKGIATDIGGKTAHAALLARAYGIPTVVGLHKISQAIRRHDRVVVDGNAGVVVVNPDKTTLAHYRAEQNKRDKWREELGQLRRKPARTTDGHDIALAANLEFTDELKWVLQHGAKGIGLFRTEYLYLGRTTLPTEDEQYDEYNRIAKTMLPHPVIVRTMDLGGDKHPQSIEIPPEANPMLGWRAIRICLERPEIFITQIKAILRANTHGNLRILLPMISAIEELEKALALIAEAKSALKKQHKTYAVDTEVGVMIEVPAAALLADAIAERVDFLSIGTNDLVQYLLAVDRGNERIAHLYETFNPAVLRVIKSVIDAGHSRGVWVGMCGEMAADRLATALLVGMGIDELSVSPIDVPVIKKIIRSTARHEAEVLARQILQLSTVKEITETIKKFMRLRFKDFNF